MKKRNCIIGQSGGPTVVINSTLAGVIEQAYLKSYDHVYGMINGISGLLYEEIMDLSQFKDKELRESLVKTPAMYLGSCRFKISKDDNHLKEKIINILLKYEIDDFFYIGGNDSMDTIMKLDQYAKMNNIKIHFIGIPKTIDNDLLHTLYTPGYPSACQYVSTTLLEIAYDSRIYPMKSITIVEIMGRDAGWLTAASAIVNEVEEDTIDFICMPEIPFDKENFLIQLKNKLQQKQHIIIAVSEGVKDQYGVSLSLENGIKKDAFGHISHSGSARYLKTLISNTFDVKVRAIELNTLQRCSAHLSCDNDINNSIQLGHHAVECALQDLSGIMITIGYKDKFIFDHFDIYSIANKVKGFPIQWIDPINMGISQDYIKYITPIMYENSKIKLPHYLKRNDNNKRH